MIVFTFVVITLVMGYLAGRHSALVEYDKLTKEHIDLLDNEVKELRKWKAEHIGKEKA